jgi:nitrogen regulatory protein PII
MDQFSNLSHYQLLVVIANNHDGSKVLKIAKENQIHGGTIVLGYGTKKRPILEFLELTDIKKEIVLMIADRKVLSKAILKISEKLRLGKKNTGILFVIPVSQFLGTGHYDYHENIVDGGHNMTMYKAIFTIVDKGKGNLVVESAKKQGSKGSYYY